MKHVWKAACKTGAIWLIGLGMLCNTLWLVLEAKVLEWVAEAINTQTFEYLCWVIGGIIAMTVLDAILQMCHMSRHLIFTRINNQLNDQILDADVAMFLETSPGKVATIAESTWQICMLVEHWLELIRNLCSVFINAYMILKLAPSQWWIFSIIAVILALSLLVLDRFFNELDSRCHEIKSKRNIESDEIINGFMEVRTFSGVKEAHRKFIHSSNDEMIWLLFKRQCCNMVMDLLTWLGSGVLTVVIILFSYEAIRLGIYDNTMAMTLVVYVFRLDRPFCNFVFGWSNMSEIRAKLPDFNKLLDYKPKIVDGTIELDEIGDNFSIEFKNVSFAYDKSSNIIHNVSMKFGKGKHYGICGVSGGGKTTLLKLLNRFYDPDEGSILINGIDIKKYKLESLRKHFGCVHQDVFIFAGTIRDNIAYALKPAVVSDERIIEACQKAGLWEFVKSLKDGLDTKVGNRGLRLSGGQQQRVALARLFLADPEVIILDEATSALDNETERIVKQALDMFNTKTIIAVAHRLSTICNSDMIYVMVGGCIEEFGTHNELVALNGAYAKMLPKDGM